MNESNISLRLLKKKDISGMLEWMHDPKVNCFFRFDAEHMTAEKAEDFVEKSLHEAEEKKSFNYAIVDSEDEYLGTISLKDVDWDAKVAEYAISLRSAVQGRGVATIATKQVLDKAFDELKLNRVFLNVLADNEKAIHLYEKCGFKYEGLFHNHVSIKGTVKSLKWYGILKDDWRDKHGKNNAK